MSNPSAQTKKISLASFSDKISTITSATSKPLEVVRLAPKRRPPIALSIIEHTASTNFAVRKQVLGFLNIVAQIYKAHTLEADYIPACSNWTYADRFAVWFRKPTQQTLQPSKAEMVEILSFGRPTWNDMVTLGFSIYAYAPQYTEPFLPAVLYVLSYAPQPVILSDFKLVTQHVWVPPQLPMMLKKARSNMSKELSLNETLVSKLVNQVIGESSLDAQQDIAFIDKIPISTTTVDAMMRWIKQGDISPSSPGFPWNSMKKEDGSPWGNFSATNVPLMEAVFSTVRRLLVALIGGLSTAKVAELADELAFTSAWKKGQQLYAAIAQHALVMDQHVLNEQSTQKKVDSLVPHIVWTLASGNVKPVSLEDIKDGKPNRSIFQSSALLRVLMARTGQMIAEGWKHHTHLSHFGWARGGAYRVVKALFNQFPNHAPEFIPVVPNSPAFGTEPEVRELVEDSFCFATPDISAQDQNFAPAYFDVTYRVLYRDFVSKISTRNYALALWALYGFYAAAEVNPVILTNNGVTFRGNHLNPSGGNLTSIHSQNQAACAAAAAKQYPWGSKKTKDYPAIAVEFGSLNKGDDSLFAFHVDFPVGKFLMTHAEVTSVLGFTTQAQREAVRQHIASRLRKFAEYCTKNLGFSWKADSLDIYDSFSACTFLGYNIYMMPETARFGVQAFVAARPLWKALFTLVWSQHRPPKTSPMTPQLCAGMRCFAVAYDTILVYPSIHTTLARLYDHLFAQCKNGQITDMRFMEIGDLELPEITTLPETLPLLDEVFHWMTGLEPVKFNEVTVQASDEEGFENSDDLPTATGQAAQDPDGKSHIASSVDDDFEASFDFQ